VRRRLLLAFLIALSPTRLLADAAPAYLVADLNTDPVEYSDSSPYGFVTLDGVAYFAADDGLLGHELWRSDGTPAGTRLVKDIDPGELGSTPRALAAIGGELWFRAWDGRRGCGVWRSDGSEEGTRLVAIVHTNHLRCVRTDADGGQPSQFTGRGDAVFFTAAAADEQGSELWRSDGTAAGTRQVADIFPGDAGSGPQALIAFDGQLYFVADDGEHGAELWRSDGTAAGTRMVRDINPGAAAGILRSGDFGAALPRLIPAGDHLVFAADDGVHGFELWRSDGSTAGTALLLDTTPDSALGGLRLGRQPTLFAAFGDEAAFFSLDVQAPPLTLRVWRTDGTAQGTEPLGELPFTGSVPTGLTAIGDAVYFAYRGAGAAGLWRADGTASVVRHFVGRVGPPLARDGAMVFLADDDSGCALWGSDGSDPGTVLLRGAAPRADLCPDELTLETAEPALGGLGGRVLFAAASAGQGSELFISDGTPAGTQAVRDVNDTSQRTADTSLWFAGALGDVLLFGAQRGIGQPSGLWRSDGSAPGTRLLAPVSPGGGGAVGGRFVFTGSDGQGAALWSTDGTTLGTHRIQSILPGPWAVTATPAALFLTLVDDAGSELWRSDGTATGTFRVADLTPGPGDTTFSYRVAFAGGLAFVVQRTVGDELWFSDGSEDGTSRVKAFTAAPNRIRDLVDVDGVLYLDIEVLGGGAELWRSDGTEDGTVRIVTLDEPPAWLAPGRGALFFAGSDAGGLELWRSDGTAGGTGRVRDIQPGPGSGLENPDRTLFEQTARAGDVFLVVADDGPHGPELWRSDGSEAGTVLVRDIDPRVPALLDDFFLPLTEVGGQVLFTPLDAEAGVEPWVTDGTADGTRLIADIAPGARSGLRQGAPFAVTRTHVFFTAADGRTGEELWAIPRAALDGGPGCGGDCNGDFRVAIDELVRGVGIALGATPVSACVSFDVDADGAVSIDELVGAVNAALGGC